MKKFTLPWVITFISLKHIKELRWGSYLLWNPILISFLWLFMSRLLESYTMLPLFIRRRKRGKKQIVHIKEMRQNRIFVWFHGQWTQRWSWKVKRFEVRRMLIMGKILEFQSVKKAHKVSELWFFGHLDFSVVIINY